MLVQIIVEPFRECGRIVDAALEALSDAEQIEIHLQIGFGVAQQEALLEVGERLALFQPVIGRQHRAAGDASDEVDAVEQGRWAIGHRRLVKSSQHAVGKRRRASAAAGKGQRNHRVVGQGLGAAAEFKRLRSAGRQRLIDRLVVDRLGTGGQQGGTRYDAPRLTQTLPPPPHLLRYPRWSPVASSKRRHCERPAFERG